MLRSTNHAEIVFVVRVVVGATPLRQACSKASTSPLVVTGTPSLGQTVTIETLSSSRLSESGSQRMILIGSSRTSASGVPLPFDIAPFTIGRHVYCGFLLQSSTVQLPLPSHRGLPQVERVPIAIPNDAVLVGGTFNVQVLGQVYTGVIQASTTTLTAGATILIGRWQALPGLLQHRRTCLLRTTLAECWNLARVAPRALLTSS